MPGCVTQITEPDIYGWSPWKEAFPQKPIPERDKAYRIQVSAAFASHPGGRLNLLVQAACGHLSCSSQA
ncbi:hypothetical protein [Paenibacillus helianthi]|uniref:hypothetical protein n=1 Tax=Paenibacillus helianthi TaxID=1349432 RepID=UPI001160EDF5|nr:hypothetical protein [Paenibacillus helianthi]